MTDLGPNPFDNNGNMYLDQERKAKVFEIAKHLKKSCYHLSVAYQDDEWLVVCSASIYGTLYQSANVIDAFSVQDHADLFRMAFSNALKQQEIAREKKTIILPPGSA
jgi:hypothetical protein